MGRQPPPWAVRTAADRRAIAEGCDWDQAAADRVIRFAETYVSNKYAAGAADQFRLFPWQVRFLSSIYAWRRPDGGRRFRRVLLHVPKKNGKTLLVSVIALYELLAAGVRSPLVASASTTKENAKQVYEQLVACIDRNKALAAVAKPVEYRKHVKLTGKRQGEYRALSADAPNAEGLNCSAVIVDEAHAHRSPKLFRTLEYAMIGRPDGFMVIISTAGDDLTHWYYGLVQRGRNVLAGADTDPTLYVELYEADPEKDDLDAPATWSRVNPSLDQYPGFTADQFAREWEAAKKNTADRLSFERYRFNIFRRAEDVAWIDLAAWDRCKSAVPDELLRQCPCWLGFDGSASIDPSSLAAVWLLPDRRFYGQCWSWVVEDGVREREKTNLPKYREFIADGVMAMDGGRLIDKRLIRAKILDLKGRYRVQSLAMDPTGNTFFGFDLANQDGISVGVFPQSFKYFTRPTKELNELVLAGRFAHDGNAWLRWCVHSARLTADDRDNCRIIRRKSVDKIDGAIALLMALLPALDAAVKPPEAPSVYASRGVLLV